MTNLRIGTRRSPLALAQAEEVRLRLEATGVLAEIVPMTTSGDEGAEASSSPQGLKGLWIDTILDALEAGEIDLAVHSAKDLPADDDEGFTIAAVPEREDPGDVLVSREAATLPAGALIGTSSLRRRAQLLAGFPGLEVVELRGNVQTRLRKVEHGEVDAAVLAAAGLARLGLAPEHARALPLAMMVPAPGQGCLAVQTRDDDDDTMAAVAPLDHAPSHRALDAERSLMWRLGGGCALPLGAHAVVGAEAVSLSAIVATPDGTTVLRVQAEGGTPEDSAEAAAKELIELGAERILAEVEGEAGRG
ncbi:MAG TPA: hydroxymethylbilane synthase [Actinomycetota bacterium]|nr:hydroxymethylbilane synthase [Actinomycetota bacterium]